VAQYTALPTHYKENSEKVRRYIMRKFFTTVLLLALAMLISIAPVASADNYGIVALNRINDISITDYGATANDTKDDTAAIQNAITAAALQGKAVFVPKGVFLCNADAVSTSNAEMYGTGPGSILKQLSGITNPSGSWTAVLKFGTPTATAPKVDTSNNVKNIYLHDFCLQGNAATGALRDHVNLIAMYGVSDVKLQNMTLLGPEGDAIYISGHADNSPASVTPSTVTHSGTTATYTTSAAHGLTTGQSIVTAGFTSTVYNGTFKITVTDATHFTVTLPSDPGADPTVKGYYVLQYELHNERITLDNVTIDGVNNRGRNGISIIDCDGFYTSRLYITNTTAVGMPGAVDIEQNANYNVVRNINISDYQLTNFNGSGIQLLSAFGQADYTHSPVSKITFQNGRIYSNASSYTTLFGIYCAQMRRDAGAITDANTASMGLNLIGNDIGGVTYGASIGGIKGSNTLYNIFRNNPGLGLALGEANSTSKNVIDAQAAYNYFDSCGRTGNGCGLQYGSILRGIADSNIFYDCGGINGAPAKGFGIFFTGGTGSNISLLNNSFVKVTSDAHYAVGTNGDFTHTAATNIWRGNKLVNMDMTASTVQFPAMTSDDYSGIITYSASGAITVTNSHTGKITAASVAAMTVAAAPAYADGVTITIESTTAYAHTITFTGTTLYSGISAAKTTATFAPYIGAIITFQAMGGKWYLVSSQGVTLS
jgi:hypothetical protein